MSLVAQYLFNDNGNDKGGNYNGAPVDVTYESAPADKNFGGKVAVFNGSTSKIDLPNISPLAGTTSKTVEFWQYTVSKSSWMTTFGFGADAMPKAFCCMLYGNSLPTVDLLGSRPYFGSTQTPTGSWHYHVFTCPASTSLGNIAYYFDATKVAITSTNTDQGSSVNPGNANYAIGYRRITNSCFINAKVANLRVYDSVLTADEIQEHYLKESVPPPPELSFPGVR